ncbi:TatD family hydrolase [Candidatus Uhrbacteria bacterium]|nr:TatD family hydrolase [Candidatus Uhrbacteria bacterium]
MATLPTHFDTHTHLDHAAFTDAWEVSIRRALEQGTWMVLIGSDYPSSVRAVDMAAQFGDGVYAAIGVHPLAFEQAEEPDVLAVNDFAPVDAFRELAAHPKVVAIGEVGLDFHNIRSALPEDELRRELVTHLQYEALDRFLELSREFCLPLILHVRGAENEMLQHLSAFEQRYSGFDARGIVHHFTGDWNQARRYIEAGFLLSCTGMLARSHTRHEAIRKIPLDKLVVESECPHLVPRATGEPRGEPAHLPNVLADVALVRRVALEEVSRATMRNAVRIFPRIIRTLA